MFYFALTEILPSISGKGYLGTFKMINNPVAIESLGIDPMKTFEEISPVDH